MTDFEPKFAMDYTVKCYCGKKVKIKYDESTGLKDVRCKNCGYSHLDIVYTLRQVTKKYVNEYTFKKW